MQILLVLTACLILRSEAISQNDTDYVCLPTAVIDTTIKELELLDGLRLETEAQKIMILGYEDVIENLQAQIANSDRMNALCDRDLNLAMLEKAKTQIDLEKMTKQRNIFGGSTIALIILMILLL